MANEIQAKSASQPRKAIKRKALPKQPPPNISTVAFWIGMAEALVLVIGIAVLGCGAIVFASNPAAGIVFLAASGGAIAIGATSMAILESLRFIVRAIEEHRERLLTTVQSAAITRAGEHEIRS